MQNILSTIHLFKIGDVILYDRFEGLKPAIKGVVTGYVENRDNVYIWVNCDDEMFMTPPRKLRSFYND